MQIPGALFAGEIHNLFFLSRFGLLGYKIILLIMQVPGMKAVEIFARGN
jgi:hypothetical protein